jgi:hypothetical protein
MEDFRGAIVHLDRERHMQFPQRPAQQFMHGWVELEKFRSFVELPLSDLKRIGTFGFHIFSRTKRVDTDCVSGMPTTGAKPYCFEQPR